MTNRIRRHNKECCASRGTTDVHAEANGTNMFRHFINFLIFTCVSNNFILFKYLSKFGVTAVDAQTDGRPYGAQPRNQTVPALGKHSPHDTVSFARVQSEERSH